MYRNPRKGFGLLVRHGLLAALLLAPAAPPALARGSSDESRHLLTHSGGIAAPSLTSSLGENPAGLVHHQRMKVHGALASSNDDFDPLGLGGFLFTGNGTAGLGLGVQTYNSELPRGSTLTLLELGLAVTIQSLNTAIGVDVSHQLHKSGPTRGSGGERASDGDVGILYNPDGDFRVGATAFQVLGSVSAYGAGIASDVGSSGVFALDATVDSNGDGLTLKPSLSVGADKIHLMIGYGFRIDDKAGSWMRTGVSAGLGLELGQNAELEAYYNQLAQYYAGVSLAF